MLGFERKAEIATLLERAGRVEVASLSERFDVCKETIRRDLRELEREGIIRRTHGGAVLDQGASRASAEFPVGVREIPAPGGEDPHMPPGGNHDPGWGHRVHGQQLHDALPAARHCA